MNKEFSYGGVVFRREKGHIVFLLIYSGRNKIWGLPKGHIEPGENAEEAAVREIREETGLSDLRKTGDFRQENIYETVSKRELFKGQIIEKHSIYFLYETGEQPVTVDNHEITDYRWLTMEKGKVLLPFTSLRTILGEAHKFLTCEGKKSC